MESCVSIGSADRALDTFLSVCSSYWPLCEHGYSSGRCGVGDQFCRDVHIGPIDGNERPRVLFADIRSDGVGRWRSRGKLGVRGGGDCGGDCGGRHGPKTIVAIFTNVSCENWNNTNCGTLHSQGFMEISCDLINLFTCCWLCVLSCLVVRNANAFANAGRL